MARLSSSVVSVPRAPCPGGSEPKCNWVYHFKKLLTEIRELYVVYGNYTKVLSKPYTSSHN
jgi:hypothetical protein